MRFLILNTDYAAFLLWLYARHPGLETQSYGDQLHVRIESLFGVADFYSSNLRMLGHEAWDIHANNEFLQRAWANEHGVRVRGSDSGSRRARRILQRIRRVAGSTLPRYVRLPLNMTFGYLQDGRKWLYDILEAQIRHYRPDVLLNQAMDGISGRFLRKIRSYVGLLVGQHGSPSVKPTDLRWYDLIVSLLPDSVERFRRNGIPSELHRLAFEPRVLSRLTNGGKTVDVSFVGSFSDAHSRRVALLESLAGQFDRMRIWGPGVGHLPQESMIRQRYVGEAWGQLMYQALHDSKVTLNHHGDSVACAANMRLFEATGVGTLLITDWRERLPDLFVPGREIITYRTPEECAQLVRYYIENEKEREAIARAGQERTLREHTYYRRMQELVDIVDRYLSSSQRASQQSSA